MSLETCFLNLVLQAVPQSLLQTAAVMVRNELPLLGLSISSSYCVTDTGSLGLMRCCW